MQDNMITAHESVNKSLLTTYTGINIDVFNPTIDDIAIEDIAHALSNITRYGGHAPYFYSVAEHSVLCSYVGENQLDKLLHDASEAYLGDLPRPIKHTKEFKFYRDIEENLQGIIFEKFGLTYPMVEDIHVVDDLILRMEMAQFRGEEGQVRFLTPEEYKKLFLDRYYELKK